MKKIEPKVKLKNPKLLIYSIDIQMNGVMAALYFGKALAKMFMKIKAITK